MTTHALMPFGTAGQEPAAEVQEHVNLCVFQVGTEDMVLDIMRIREILRPMPVTPLPRAAPGVKGLINVRGTVMPLLDVRVRFGLAAQEKTPRQRIMVVLDRRRLQGLLVDAVHEVARVPRDAITPGTGVFTGESGDVFSGVVQQRGRMVLMLNLSRFLDREAVAVIPPLPVKDGGR
jgi:purine-binding chemotaxis protein CheW